MTDRYRAIGMYSGGLDSILAAKVIAEEGIEGRLLRPLSALLLEPSSPEREGAIDRSHLYGFSGRSRKPQKELAWRYGIDWYPDSGGGCLLTDTSFAAKYADLEGSAEDTVTVIASKGSLKRELVVQPASQKDIEPFFIG